MVQIVDEGLEKILTEIIQTCIDMNWSDGYSGSLTENFGINGKKL